MKGQILFPRTKLKLSNLKRLIKCAKLPEFQPWKVYHQAGINQQAPKLSRSTSVSSRANFRQIELILPQTIPSTPPATGHVLGQLGSHMVSESFDSLSGKFICFLALSSSATFWCFAFNFWFRKSHTKREVPCRKKRKLRLQSASLFGVLQAAEKSSFNSNQSASWCFVQSQNAVQLFAKCFFQNTSLKI